MRSETVKRIFFVLFVCGVLLALVLGTPSLFQHAVPGKRLPSRVWAYPLDDPGLYGSDALQRGAHFFKPVYTWSDYTDAPIRQLEVKLESETGLLPWIQAIDGDLHALVTYGGDLGAAAPRLANGTWASREHSSFPLVEVNLQSGKARTLFTPDPYCYADVLAVTREYILWTEAAVRTSTGTPYGQTGGTLTTSRYGKSVFAPEIRLYDRKSGKDHRIPVPEWESSVWSSSSPAPYSNALFFEGSLYFDLAMERTTKQSDFRYVLYRYDIGTRTLHRIGEDLLQPLVWKAQPAWRAWSLLNGDSRLMLKAGETTVLGLRPGQAGVYREPVFAPAEWGMAGQTPFLLEQEDPPNVRMRYGVRRWNRSSWQPVLSLVERGTLCGNLVEGFAGLAIWDDSQGQTCTKYLYDPDIDGLVRLDGRIPSELRPVLSGAARLGDAMGCVTASADTTRMMYLTDDSRPSFDGHYTLCWFDVKDLQKLVKE